MADAIAALLGGLFLFWLFGGDELIERWMKHREIMAGKRKK